MVDGIAPMPVCNVQPSWTKVARVGRDRPLDLRRRRIDERERRAVALDDHVDRVHVHAVRVLRREAERAREVRVRLDDEQPVRVFARALHLAHRRARVQREAHPAVGVGRRRAGCDDARCELLGDGHEPAEVGGHELDAGAAVDEHPLGRPEEAADVADSGPAEQGVEVEQQRTEDVEVLPVVALPQRVQERRRVAGTERDPEGVAWAEQRDRLREGALLRHAPLAIRPARVPEVPARWVRAAPTAVPRPRSR